VLVKHINRTSKEDEDLKKHYNQNTDAADEWSHITGVGSKIEVRDAMDVSERSITFSNKSRPQTKQEIVQEKSEEFKDNMTNTHQYQKFVNVLLQERVKDLKKMLDNEKRFAEEMSFFQDPKKDKTELNRVNPKYVTQNDAKIIVDNLESEYKSMKERLDHEQSRIQKTKLDLETKKQQIEQLKDELQYLGRKQQKQEPQADPILVLKHELKKLGISDDSGKIAKALEMLQKKVDTPES
jgi:uncharacterized protein (DUF3084 family)